MAARAVVKQARHVAPRPESRLRAEPRPPGCRHGRLPCDQVWDARGDIAIFPPPVRRGRARVGVVPSARPPKLDAGRERPGAWRRRINR